MEIDKQRYTEQTALLDYTHPTIVALIKQQGWLNLPILGSRIAAIYTFVRDAIPFGYGEHFAVPASQVLAQGMGNCLTKTTLLMALLRAVGVPCRLKAAMISKVIHRGLLGEVSFLFSPRHLHHTWVELYFILPRPVD